MTMAMVIRRMVDVGLIPMIVVMMMAVVTFVSLMVHIYTIGYMAHEEGYERFFSYIALFTFSMLMLVMSNNFLQLFFGWEAVGLVSYLLIGFWYTRPTAIYANLKAFLVNRVGDFGFLLGIGAISRHLLALLKPFNLRIIAVSGYLAGKPEEAKAMGIDQLVTIEALKQDMVRPRPMDRLMCGDVGYGKTEVAMRAAFKAVMGGKQVAVLVPTTILAQQHHTTFTDRLADYPVEIDVIDVTRRAARIMGANRPNDDGEKGVVVNVASIAAFEAATNAGFSTRSSGG